MKTPPRLWTRELVLDDVLEIAGLRRTGRETWAREYLTADPPKRRRKGSTMAEPAGRVGKIIEETPEETAAYERGRTSPVDGRDPLSPEQHELLERRAARTRKQDDARTRWLETSGFAAVIARAEALLADMPRAMDEHHRAQAALPDLADFVALAAEVPEDPVLRQFARRAQDLARTIASPPPLVENAGALRALIARVKAADLEGVNGVRNSNLTAAWTRQFRELLTPLPGPGHAAWCAQQIKALLAEARAARAGR